MNRNHDLELWFCALPHFMHFEGVAIYTMGCVAYDMWHSGLAYYMYIYSLRHFLTTKGALIDGDGYPPKNPKKGSKKGHNLIKN